MSCRSKIDTGHGTECWPVRIPHVSRGCDNVISWCVVAEAGRDGRPGHPAAALQHSLQYCSRSALCSWARERRWPWCGGQSFTSVGIFSVDIVFIFTNDRETCFYVLSSCHHLPLLIPPVRVSAPMLCGDLATATAVTNNNNNAVVQRCSAQSCSHHVTGQSTTAGSAQCSAGM